jgi:phosphoribosylanthranilate isomerase
MSAARTRVKVCGITRLEDALKAVECGADAIGFVFYEPSPRYITPEQAQKICAALPPFVTVVALTVDATSKQVSDILEHVPVALMQFHGNETEEQCQAVGLPYIKAIRVRDHEDVYRAQSQFQSALGILVDTYKKGVPGGTGEVFDWDLIPTERSKPLILAGGLKPENVRTAISSVKPFAVDVSGGVEAGKGVKSPELLERFLNEVSGGS